MNSHIRKFRNGIIVEPKKTWREQATELFANVLGLIYHVILGLVHSYAWYVLFLKNIFMLSSPIYILLPITIATIIYYAARYYIEPEFSYNNAEKLQNIWLAIKQQAKDIWNNNYFNFLAMLIMPSFGIIFFLYCATNSLTPNPADMMLYLAQPMLATLAVIAALSLIYLAIKPLRYKENTTKVATKKAEEKPQTSTLKTITYILASILFYVACGIVFGAIANLFFSPILHHTFYQLSSLASWMITMGGGAGFFSLNLLSCYQDQEFKEQAAEFCDAIHNSRLLTTLYNVGVSAIFSVMLAIIIFSIMFAPMIHIVPNILPHIFSSLSQTAFRQALMQVVYTSAAISVPFSLLNSACTIKIPETKKVADRFNDFHTQLNPAPENHVAGNNTRKLDL